MLLQQATAHRQDNRLPPQLRSIQVLADTGLIAVVASLAGDMPLRNAAADPSYRPNLSSAAMRLQRFASFYPVFSGGALFSPDGRMLTNAQYRERHVPIVSACFDLDEDIRPLSGMLEDPALAALIHSDGTDRVIFATVKCPYGDTICGVVAARLR